MEIKAPDFRKREDRLRPWLDGELRTFLFDRFSAEYCRRTGTDFLRGVDIPFKAGDLSAFREEGGLAVTDIADNMASVIGADTHFVHRDAYIAYMAKYFNEKLTEVLAHKGASELAAERFRRAAVYFRAALLLDSQHRDAMFGYACCCRQWYLSLEGEDEEELISVLKADASEYYEHTVRIYPDHAASHYFLGYVYANAGQYRKAQIVWKKFLSLAKAGGDAQQRDAAPPKNEEVKEIEERLASLEDPVKIEAGIADLAAGRYEEGLRALEPYTGTSYGEWWPLHYYLANAYEELGFGDEASEGFRKVLALNPSHEESCRRLAELCEAAGDAEGAAKYSAKAELIARNSRGE